jgi:hypothetical protein
MTKKIPEYFVLYHRASEKDLMVTKNFQNIFYSIMYLTIELINKIQ